jgi:hypothetical protein
MHKVDWLDRLTFREIEMVNEVKMYIKYDNMNNSIAVDVN